MPKLTEFGQKDGLPLVQAVLEGANSQVSILSLGAITQSWQHTVGDSTSPVVLGYENPTAYLTDLFYFGAIVGRVANRTAFGHFALGGQAYTLPINNPPHHLHGGPEGTQRWNFAFEPDRATNSVTLTHTSPDGHMGYPGVVEFTICIRLVGDRLTYDMTAIPDRPTPINLAQHSYYNLSGAPICRDHKLWVASKTHMPTDESALPTGQIVDNAGSKFDFSKPRTLQQADPDKTGFDTNMILNPERDFSQPCATVSAGGRRLDLYTDQPGLQLYDSLHLTRVSGGHSGRTYSQFSGLAIEPQAFPNIVNTPELGSIIATPEHPYRQVTAVEITRGMES